MNLGVFLPLQFFFFFGIALEGWASFVAQLVRIACNVGDLGSIPGLGRSPREGNGYPLQYSGLENSMDCMVHGVAKSRTWLSNWTELNFWGFPHSSVGKKSACNAGGPWFDSWLGKIPRRRERLPTPVSWLGEFHGQSMGLQRVGHDWVTFTHFT